MSGSLKEKITELVNRHWRVNGRALLLSSLGPALSMAGYNHRMILGETKLSDYIARECKDTVTIIEHPHDSQVLGLLPVDAPVPSGETISNLFVKSDKTGPRYQRGTWAAFLVDLRPRFRRFVSMNPPFEFKDVPEYTPLTGDDYIEVDRKFIKPSYEGIVPTEKTRERLEGWAAEKRIDPGIFQIRGAATATTADVTPSHNVMHLLFDLLTTEELSRIRMPLDVVRKLFGSEK